MKIEKNKIVFAAVLTVILLFLIGYALKLAGTKEEAIRNKLKETGLPELENDKVEYDSRLEAVDAIDDTKERDAPSLYPDRFMDSLGVYDSLAPNDKKETLIDSIYSSDTFDKKVVQTGTIGIAPQKPLRPVSWVETQLPQKSSEVLALDHQLFFASSNVHPVHRKHIDSAVTVVVDEDQVVQINSRLRLRLIQSVRIADKTIKDNTLVYGSVSLQPNRVLVEVSSLGGIPIALSAYDYQDGEEGLYIENNFRQEASRALIDDALGDVNIPSVPQLRTLAKLFKRDNRNIKITMLNNYKLLLKP